MLATDSLEYDILERAAKSIIGLDINALTCEIGLRAGGGSKVIIDALVESGQTARTHIAIDPYGNIEYETSQDNRTRHDYTNNMRNRCFKELYQYIDETHHNTINVLVFPLEDSEFFERFASGVPVYEEYKRLATAYALVHFDGPHAYQPLIDEINFFMPRILPGTMFIFDDIANYNHDDIEQYILSNGFALVEKESRKASYVYKPL